jgi:hypothetical protein
MAGNEPGQHRSARRIELKPVSRRKVMLGFAAMLLVIVVCVGAIVVMLQRLETRNANFQPPMTSRERERLLPPEPTLVSSPELQGMHYREGAGDLADPSPPLNGDRGETQILMSHSPSLNGSSLHANGEPLRQFPSQTRP